MMLPRVKLIAVIVDIILTYIDIIRFCNGGFQLVPLKDAPPESEAVMSVKGTLSFAKEFLHP